MGQVLLDSETPHILLKARDEKARRGALVPLRKELADAHWHHIAGALTASQKVAALREAPISVRLDPTRPLFDLPKKMTRIFDRDLEAAGFAKKDAHGRSVDVHSLRHTFATMLARAGVSLQQAQALMRYFDPRSLQAPIRTSGLLTALPP